MVRLGAGQTEFNIGYNERYLMSRKQLLAQLKLAESQLSSRLLISENCLRV